jgi:hypothetical protein
MTDMYSLPCLKCGKVSPPAMPGGSDNLHSPPSHALFFLTYGNYGSTVFDSVLGAEYLLVIICDDCITAAGEEGIVMHCTKPSPIPADPVRRLWKLGEA